MSLGIFNSRIFNNQVFNIGLERPAGGYERRDLDPNAFIRPPSDAEVAVLQKDFAEFVKTGKRKTQDVALTIPADDEVILMMFME